MPIRKIKFKKSAIYHVYNCGGKSSGIFLKDEDKERFFQSIFLANNCNSYRGIAELEKRKDDLSVKDITEILKAKKIVIKPLVEIHSVCLMPDHFHFLLKESEKNGISKFMQKICNGYGKYFSKRRNFKGNVFKGRFKTAEIINDSQLACMLSYINMINPAQLIEPYLKLKGVENFSLVWDAAKNYKWSSNLDFSGLRSDSIINASCFKKHFLSHGVFLKFCEEILMGKKKNFWDEIKDVSID